MPFVIQNVLNPGCWAHHEFSINITIYSDLIWSHRIAAVRLSRQGPWRGHGKIGIATDHEQNLISSIGSQNTTAWTFSDYSHSSSRKCPETPNSIVSLCQNAAKMRKPIDSDQNLFIYEGNTDKWAWQISGPSFHALSRKCLSKVKISPKSPKSKEHDRNLINSGGQDSSAL